MWLMDATHWVILLSQMKDSNRGEFFGPRSVSVLISHCKTISRRFLGYVYMKFGKWPIDHGNVRCCRKNTRRCRAQVGPFLQTTNPAIFPFFSLKFFSKHIHATLASSCWGSLHSFLAQSHWLISLLAVIQLASVHIKHHIMLIAD